MHWEWAALTMHGTMDDSRTDDHMWANTMVQLKSNPFAAAARRRFKAFFGAFVCCVRCGLRCPSPAAGRRKWSACRLILIRTASIHWALIAKWLISDLTFSGINFNYDWFLHRLGMIDARGLRPSKERPLIGHSSMLQMLNHVATDEAGKKDETNEALTEINTYALFPFPLASFAPSAANTLSRLLAFHRSQFVYLKSALERDKKLRKSQSNGKFSFPTKNGVFLRCLWTNERGTAEKTFVESDIVCIDADGLLCFRSQIFRHRFHLFAPKFTRSSISFKVNNSRKNNAKDTRALGNENNNKNKFFSVSFLKIQNKLTFCKHFTVPTNCKPIFIWTAKRNGEKRKNICSIAQQTEAK